MGRNENTEFDNLIDVLDSEIAETLREISDSQHVAALSMTETHFCRAHNPMAKGISVLLKCQRVALAQEKNRTKVAAGWASGVAAVMVAAIELVRRLIEN
jgi:hypothetical protein